MKEIVVVLFTFASFGLVIWGLLRRTGMYEYPFLVGTVFAGWLLPQAIGLYSNQFLPEGGYERTIFMATLCVAAVYIGNISCRTPWRTFNWKMDDQRLLIGAAALSAFGFFFNMLIGEMNPEELGQQWTGISTIYFFFSQAQIFGYAISVLLYARTRRIAALVLAGINFVFYLQIIIYAARRGLAIEIGLIPILAFWFGRGWVIPRALMLGGAIVAMFLTFSIAQIRKTGFEHGYGGSVGHVLSLEELSNINFSGIFEDVLSKGSDELTSAIYNISATAELGSYSFGAFYWNSIVFGYVPAQFLGRDLKLGLMFNIEEDAPLKLYGFQPTPGATPTGLSDSFGAFWYLGAAVFLVISRIMAKLYLAAVRQHRAAQVLYMVSITTAMHAVTHTTAWFFIPWIQYFIFLWPVFAWARVRNLSTEGPDYSELVKKTRAP